MQRAAASAPLSKFQSPSRNNETLPLKRQKTQNSPTKNASPSGLELIQTALEDEEQRREKAIERLAQEAGETKWVLSTLNGGAGLAKSSFCVEQAAFSDLDQEAWSPATIGRRSFGKFNQDLEVGYFSGCCLAMERRKRH